MKKLALLFLFAPVLSHAAVTVQARARCGEDSIEQTFQLNDEQKSFSIENECGTRTTVTLISESAEGAEFEVRVQKEQTRDKDAVDSDAVLVKALYGESVKHHCESCVIDADFEMMVSPIQEEIVEVAE